MSGSGSVRRSCRLGRARPRRSARCFRCCICTGSRREISCRRWGSSWAARRGCRPRRSPSSPRPGRPEAQAFAERDLSGVDFVYLWADGIHVNVRLGDQKLCLLVMIGVRADGRKELVALTDGYREAAESWADLLRDCRRRGMRAPVWPPGTGRWDSGARCARVWPEHPRAALLVPQDIECSCRAAEVGAPGGEEDARRDLERRGQVPRPRRGQTVRGDLWCEVSEGGRQDLRRRRAAAGVLRLPGRALDPSENYKSDRIYLRHRAEPEQDHQGPRLPRRRNRHGLQADRGGPVTLAGGQRAPISWRSSAPARNSRTANSSNDPTTPPLPRRPHKRT